MKELVESILEEKMNKNVNFIEISFYEIRIKNDLSKNDSFEFIRLARTKLENLGYDVYPTNSKYKYKGEEHIVPENELLIAIKS